MKKALYLLPVLALVISVAAGWISADKRMNRVENFIQASFDKDEPVIVSWDPDRLEWPVRLTNLNGDSVNLGTVNVGSNWMDTTLIQTGDNRILFWYYARNKRWVELWEIQLPSGKPLHISTWDRAEHVSETTDSFLRGYRYGVSNRSSQFQLEVIDGDVFLRDSLNNTSTPVFETWFPFWDSGERTIQEQLMYSIPSSGNKIFLTPFEYDEEAGERIFWKYDIENDNWEEWLTWTSAPSIVLNPEGTVAALTGARTPTVPNIIEFLDVETKEILHRERNASSPVLGDRWAVCYDESGSGSPKLIVFDMENEWEQHDIMLSSVTMSVYSYILLEPPGN